MKGVEDEGRAGVIFLQGMKGLRVREMEGLKELWMVAMEVEVEEAEGQGKWRGWELRLRD